MTLEHTWIEHLQKRFPQADFRHDTFYENTHRTILTTDMMVEEVHFSRQYFELADIGWRAMAANLSDIAATGGKPQWALVSVGVPEETSVEDLEALYEGIQAFCQQYPVRLVGGDTVQAGQWVLSVSMTGMLPEKSTPGRRNNAEPGHIIAVSGPHGLSRAGLYALESALTEFNAVKQAHLRPHPQLKLGQQISAVLSRFAMMDSSDGLADAALRLAQASDVDIVLDASRLALHPEVTELARMAEVDPMDWVLYGGEDFQLVISLPAETLGMFPGLIPVGHVQEGNGGAYLRYADRLEPLGFDRTFQHFSPERTLS